MWLLMILPISPCPEEHTSKGKHQLSFLGTVANFETKDFKASYNKSTVSGNLSMIGIPDMRNTEVKFTNVIANANYNDISNWIPSLRSSTELNVISRCHEF